MHLLPVASLSPGVSLLLTVLSLIGFFRGVQFAWNRLHLPSYAVTALLLAQSHLLLLAAIWVGATGVLAELRGLLLAGAALYLLVQQPNTHKFVRLGVGSVTLAALAGVPLTATFAGRAGLYTAWLADGRWPGARFGAAARAADHGRDLAAALATCHIEPGKSHLTRLATRSRADCASGGIV